MSAVDGARAASAAFAASAASLVFAIIATVDGLRSVEPQPNYIDETFLFLII